MNLSVTDRIELRPASSCNTDLQKGPWEFDSSPGYGPGSSESDAMPDPTVRPGQLPVAYQEMAEPELHVRIRNAKRILGEKLVILGHFYQRDEVVQHADFVGDSFQLANAALTKPKASTIVFCGVHFMAETADILSREDQSVILPNLAAGCSMADMADEESVEDAWAQICAVYGADPDQVTPDESGKLPILPVTYMNSSAALKAFCGRHGGIVCTSSNATTVLEWAFQRAHRVLFFPDQHLGRNTAKAMGVPLEQMPLWNPRLPQGGNTSEQLMEAKVLLWHGFCSVHKRFSVAQIERARQEYPECTVIVHPESPMPVVDAADASGSTDAIRKYVEASEPGDVIAIGTEINMVNRLAAEYPDRTIFCLDPVICPCSTMYRIHPGYLAWVLDELVAGTVHNQITVPTETSSLARVALDRMLAAKPQ